MKFTLSDEQLEPSKLQGLPQQLPLVAIAKKITPAKPQAAPYRNPASTEPSFT